MASLAGLAIGCLMIGCYQPQRLPPPGAIPFVPEGATQNLFRPGGSNAPPPTVAPRSIPPAAAFPWPPDSPWKTWRYVVLHHTASTSGSVDTIDAEHQKRTDADGNPWRGIGYHFVIGNGSGMADGAIEPTFRWREQSSGAHAGVAEFNEYGIGVCLVGNFDESPPSPRQVAAARRLVAALKGACGIDTAAVVRHGDLKATACPGKLFPHEEIAAVPADVAGLRGWRPAW